MELETLLAIAIIFLAILLQGVFGFGSALLAMPLLSLILDLKVATPTFALLGATANILIVLTSWQKVELSSLWRLAIASLPGIICGVWLLHIVQKIWIMRGLGIFLIAFAGYSLGKFKLPQVEKNWAYGFGFIAGLLGGAYNINGPPIVVYANMRRWHPQQFRVTLPCYFCLNAPSILIGHALSGLWTKEVFSLYGWALPAMAIAIWLGGHINRRLPMHHFQQLIYFILIGLGILLWVVA
ncbi:MAG: sulfite exporter TauE/SafE family protein [Spirulina sp.]